MPGFHFDSRCLTKCSLVHPISFSVVPAFGFLFRTCQSRILWFFNTLKAGSVRHLCFILWHILLMFLRLHCLAKMRFLIADAWLNSGKSLKAGVPFSFLLLSIEASSSRFCARFAMVSADCAHFMAFALLPLIPFCRAASLTPANRTHLATCPLFFLSNLPMRTHPSPAV